MDTEQVVKKARQYLEIIRRFVDVEKAYVFGSHARGAAREVSDIDMAIFTASLPNDYFGTLKKLFKARRQVDCLIEPHLFVIGRDESGFQEEVIRTGIKVQ